MQKAAIFVDVQNIYYTTKEAYRKHFDYNKFWVQATKGRNVIKANAYAIAPQDEKQKQFQNILRGIGFDVRIKPYIQRADGSAKGDWDVGITLDVMETAPQVDLVVLASGDGDFDLLVERVQRLYDVEVEVYGVGYLTADTLIRSADRFMPIDQQLLLK